jgi:T5SS/PEP-CTERM-associated repeat protein
VRQLLLTRAATAPGLRSLACILAIAYFFFFGVPCSAQWVSSSGDVDPSDPTKWDLFTAAYVGKTGVGSLTLSPGAGAIQSNTGYIGYNAGAVGSVSVDGMTSGWSNENYLIVGGNDISPTTAGGSGTLTISNSGRVSDSYGAIGGYYFSTLGVSSGGTGAVTVDGSGSLWSNGTLHVGCGGTASLSITNGGEVDTHTGAIGKSPGSTGTVAVDGALSLWYNDYNLEIGRRGDATLNITNGGRVVSGVVHTYTYVGEYSGSTGTVKIDGIGSYLSAASVLVVGNSGDGRLDITRGGRCYDYPSSGNVRSDNYNDFIGYNSGSTGVVTVGGTGSLWRIDELTTRQIYVGYGGNGTLRITNGGTVAPHSYGSNGSTTSIYIGYSSGSTGSVAVDGTGSTLTIDNGLSVGVYGAGKLIATGGGVVAATDVSINPASLLTVDVGRGSSLMINNGAGTITNDGTVRIVCGAGVAADGTTYKPISAANWYGSGIYQPLGGTWDATNHTFTASVVASGSSGQSVTVNRNEKQRILITDNAAGGTGWEVGASFMPSASSLTLTATAISGDVLHALNNKLIATTQSVLSGWTFSTDGGYTSGEPIYLSLKTGPGFSTDDFSLWHYDATSGWTAYNADDLTYDGTYASFTVTGFSGYAITAVPEPSTLVLLATGLLASLFYARRMRAT